MECTVFPTRFTVPSYTWPTHPTGYLEDGGTFITTFFRDRLDFLRRDTHCSFALGGVPQVNELTQETSGYRWIL